MAKKYIAKFTTELTPKQFKEIKKANKRKEITIPIDYGYCEFIVKMTKGKKQYAKCLVNISAFNWQRNNDLFTSEVIFNISLL